MRPSTGRISLWPVAVAGFVLVFALLSITPTVKLKASPPSEFSELRASAAAPQGALAAGYWGVAVRVIQWKYNRAHVLPEQVPDDFKLAHDTAQPALAEDRAVRSVYWAKLREEWLRPENWQTTYDLDLSWPVRNARSFAGDVLRFINQT